MSEIKNLTVAYNPNDFFYYKSPLFSDNTDILNNIVNNTCSTKKCINRNEQGECIDSCRTIDPDKIPENVDINANDKTTRARCYDKELCINRENALKINKLQTNHDGATIRKDDVFSDYNHEVLKSYNLAIGSLGIIIMFYFFYK